MLSLNQNVSTKWMLHALLCFISSFCMSRYCISKFFLNALFTLQVREATSNDAWGPSTTLMSEIADLTYNVVAYAEIMPIIWRRLEDSGRNWRHVYKSLVLLDYLVRTGSERVARECRERAWAIQGIADSFEFAESTEGQDHSAGVRERARALTALLRDDDRLRNERAKALKARERFAQNSSAVSAASLGVCAYQILTLFSLHCVNFRNVRLMT